MMQRKSVTTKYYARERDGETYVLCYPHEVFDFIPDQLGKAVGELLDIEADEQRIKHYRERGFWTSGTVDCSPGEVYGVFPVIYRGYMPPPPDLAGTQDD